MERLRVTEYLDLGLSDEPWHRHEYGSRELTALAMEEHVGSP